MRLYLVRRTRSFIQDNYAETDPTTGRKYLTFADGTRSYFPDAPAEDRHVHDRRQRPTRPVRAALFRTASSTPSTRLTLPRYGLGNYVRSAPHEPPTAGRGAGSSPTCRAPASG